MLDTMWTRHNDLLPSRAGSVIPLVRSACSHNCIMQTFQSHGASSSIGKQIQDVFLWMVACPIPFHVHYTGASALQWPSLPGTTHELAG